MVQTIELIKQVAKQIENNSLKDAREILLRGLSIQHANKDIIAAIKCIDFWREREKKIMGQENKLYRGEYILQQWREFQIFLRKINLGNDDVINIFKLNLHEKAYNYFANSQYDYNEDAVSFSIDCAQCLKRIGRYGEAIKVLEQVSEHEQGNAIFLAQLADCCALTAEIERARALFREAYFVDASTIDLCMLDSSLIQNLATDVKSHGVSDTDLSEWLPVYAEIWDVFSVRCILTPIEASRLRQLISSLEQEVKEGGNYKAMPRLLCRYFRLLHHLKRDENNYDEINEILLSIRLLCPHIAQMYDQ